MIGRFKLDENMPTAAQELLRDHGLDCHTVHDERLVGTLDEHLAATCRSEDRALITLDLDFADVRAYPPSEYPGIIVLRPSHPDREAVLELVARVLALPDEETVDGALWIVDSSRIRIRR